jgi:hypothetical protein
MITKSQQKKLRKVIGTRYSKLIQAFLIEKNYLNKHGKPYSIAYISHVFNGRYSDVNIENAFFEVYNLIVNEQLKNNIERKSILNKNPEAGTSGKDYINL